MLTQERCRLDHVHCSAHLSAAPDHELLIRAYVVDEQAHEPQLLAEAHQHGEPAGVQGHAVGLLGELAPEVQGAVWCVGWGGVPARRQG